VTQVGNATHINLTEAQKERARLIMEPFCYDTTGQRLQGWEGDPLQRYARSINRLVLLSQ
jgi:hypothetical protein